MHKTSTIVSDKMIGTQRFVLLEDEYCANKFLANNFFWSRLVHERITTEFLKLAKFSVNIFFFQCGNKINFVPGILFFASTQH